MSSPYQGSCLCGAVAFQVEAFTDKVAHCHCSMCRKFHGAAYATIVGVERAKLHWLRGEDSLKRYVAPNGTSRTFCEHCGSSLLFASPRASNDIVEMALGAFDGELPVKPNVHIFVGSSANWVSIASGDTQFEQGQGSALCSKSNRRATESHKSGDSSSLV